MDFPPKFHYQLFVSSIMEKRLFFPWDLPPPAHMTTLEIVESKAPTYCIISKCHNMAAWVFGWHIPGGGEPAFCDHCGKSHCALVIHTFCSCNFGLRGDIQGLVTCWHQQIGQRPAAFRRLIHCRVLPTPTADTVEGQFSGWDSKDEAGVGGLG